MIEKAPGRNIENQKVIVLVSESYLLPSCALPIQKLSPISMIRALATSSPYSIKRANFSQAL